MISLTMSVSGHSVLDGPRQDVAIVRQPSGKWWSIIERILGTTLGLLQGGLEGVQLLPELQDLLLCLRKVDVGVRNLSGRHPDLLTLSPSLLTTLQY